MKKIIASLLCLLLLVGCSGGSDTKTDTKEETKVDEYAEKYKKMTAEELINDKIKDRTNTTVDEYVSLLETYKYVTINSQLEFETNITTEARTILNKDKTANIPKISTYVDKLLSNSAEQVRGYGVSLCYGSIFGTSEETVNKVLNVVKNEKSNFVIKKAMTVLRTSGAKYEDVGKFLIKCSKSDNTVVRTYSASAIANYWNKNMDGAVDAILTLMNDSNADVKKAALRNCGELADEKVIDPIKKVLNDKTNYTYHGPALQGLLSLFYDFSSHRNTSANAYKVFMDYYKQSVTNKEVPVYTGVLYFSNKSTVTTSFDNWKTKATYYNTTEIFNMTKSLILNENLNFSTRYHAIACMQAHCTKEQYLSIQKDMNNLSDNYKTQLINRYNTILAKYS